MRRDFQTAGVVVHNLGGEGADAAERQRASRALRALADERLVVISKPKWARSTAVKLTDGGDDRARALAKLPLLDHALLADLHARRESPLGQDELGLVYGLDQNIELVWHSEFVVADVRNPAPIEERVKLIVLARRFLPAITRGLVVANATLERHVWYALTPAGVEFAEGAPPAVPKLPRADRELMGCYDDALARARARQETSPPRLPSELGEFALNASPARPRPGFAEAWGDFLASGSGSVPGS